MLVLSLAILGSVGPARGLPAEGDTWSRLRSEHFTFVSQVSGGETRTIAVNLESFRTVLSRVARQLEPRSGKPIVVFVFRDDASFEPYRREMLEDLDEVAGFMCEGRDTDYILLKARRAGDPYAVVYHEYVHQVVRQHFTAIPPWLDEGLAEYYSTFTTDGQSVTVGPPSLSNLGWLSEHPPLPLQELFNTTRRSKRYTSRELSPGFYATSWLLVHYLLSADPLEPPRLEHLLAELEAGKSEEAAHIASIGLVYRELEVALVAYVRQANYPLRSWPLEGEASAPADGALEPLPRSELLHVLGEFLAASGPAHHAAAEAHLQAAIALAPDSPGARVALAGLRLEQGRYPEASTLSLEALERGASGPIPLFRAAWSLLPDAQSRDMRVAAEVKLSPETVERARDLLRRGLALAPESGEALAVLGWTYLVKDDDSGPGIEALERARELLPSRADVAWNLAQLHLLRGDRARAVALIDGPLTALLPPEQLRVARDQLAVLDLRAADVQIREGKYEEGLERYRRVASVVTDTFLKPQVEQRLAELELYVAKHREVATYNRAVELANKKDAAGALAVLDELLKKCTTPDLCQHAGELRNSLEARSAKH